MRAILFIIVLMASGAAYAEEPVMIIRFNQESVSYEKQLYNVVKHATEIKPDVVFIANSINPRGANSSSQIKAGNRAQDFVNQLQTMGLARNQVHLSQTEGNLEFQEIHLYAR